MGMTDFDFEQVIDRRGTSAAKWARTAAGRALPLLAMTVADMEFPSPVPVCEAMAERVRHGIFGYTMAGDAYSEAVASWQMVRHRHAISPEWVVPHHGVLPSLFQMIRAFLEPGSSIIVMTPAFPPFLDAIVLNGHGVVACEMLRQGATYAIDFEEFEGACRDPAARLFILCNPHNPTGRNFTAEELGRLAEIAARHQVMVFADEIHGDLVLPPGRLVPFLSVCDGLDVKVMAANGLSKTMNLAGLGLSNLVIPSRELRERFEDAVRRSGEWGVNPVSRAAALAGYEHGGAWLDALLDHVAGNMAAVDAWCADEHADAVVPVKAEATYLKWLDTSGTGLDEEELMERLINGQNLLVQAGSEFGAASRGFVRLNLACPRSMVTTALGRISTALTPITCTDKGPTPP